jgi:tRNA (guanine-N7-)-methyltransferase
MPEAQPDSIFYRPTNWIDPFEWTDVFGNDHPVEVDVGAGKGRFLLWAAGVCPEHNFLGVERLLLRMRKADRKARRQGLNNVRLIRIEASYLVGKLIPSSTVAAYHIYFPDPWPKRRHHQRRLFNVAFAGELLRTLVPGGKLNVATDHEGYFEQMRSVMQGRPEFVACPVLPLPVEAQTDFEQEFLAASQTIHRARWQKR